MTLDYWLEAIKYWAGWVSLVALTIAACIIGYRAYKQ